MTPEIGRFTVRQKIKTRDGKSEYIANLGDCSDELIRVSTDYWEPRIGKETFEQNIWPNIQCVNDNELRLEGEDNTIIESYVRITIEHCT